MEAEKAAAGKKPRSLGASARCALARDGRSPALEREVLASAGAWAAWRRANKKAAVAPGDTHADARTQAHAALTLSCDNLAGVATPSPELKTALFTAAAEWGRLRTPPAPAEPPAGAVGEGGEVAPSHTLRPLPETHSFGGMTLLRRTVARRPAPGGKGALLSAACVVGIDEHAPLPAHVTGQTVRFQLAMEASELNDIGGQLPLLSRLLFSAIHLRLLGYMPTPSSAAPGSSEAAAAAATTICNNFTFSKLERCFAPFASVFVDVSAASSGGQAALQRALAELHADSGVTTCVDGFVLPLSARDPIFSHYKAQFLRAPAVDLASATAAVQTVWQDSSAYFDLRPATFRPFEGCVPMNSRDTSLFHAPRPAHLFDGTRSEASVVFQPGSPESDPRLPAGWGNASLAISLVEPRPPVFSLRRAAAQQVAARVAARQAVGPAVGQPRPQPPASAAAAGATTATGPRGVAGNVTGMDHDARTASFAAVVAGAAATEPSAAATAMQTTGLESDDEETDEAREDRLKRRQAAGLPPSFTTLQRTVTAALCDPAAGRSGVLRPYKGLLQPEEDFNVAITDVVARGLVAAAFRGGTRDTAAVAGLWTLLNPCNHSRLYAAIKQLPAEALLAAHATGWTGWTVPAAFATDPSFAAAADTSLAAATPAAPADVDMLPLALSGSKRSVPDTGRSPPGLSSADAGSRANRDDCCADGRGGGPSSDGRPSGGASAQ